MVPKVDQQRQIAAFLDDRVVRIDQIIAARREQIRLISETYSAWLDALISRFRQLPLRRFLRRIEQGWSPIADSVPAINGESGVLKLGAVRNGDFHPEQNKAFLRDSAPRERYRVRQGDLLITRANTATLVGDAGVVKDVGDVPLYLSDLIYRVELSGYDADLASAALRTSHVRQLIGVVARGTSGSMPKLRGEDLAELPLPIVPAEDQVATAALEMAERETRDREIAHLSQSIHLLTEYKSSLITAAVNGEIDVTTAGSGIPG